MKHKYAIEVLRWMKKEIKQTHINWMGEHDAKESIKELNASIRVLKTAK